MKMEARQLLDLELRWIQSQIGAMVSAPSTASLTPFVSRVNPQFRL